MSLLVIGSLALDTIETPFGKAERTLGGSATFISTSSPGCGIKIFKIALFFFGCVKPLSVDAMSPLQQIKKVNNMINIFCIYLNNSKVNSKVGIFSY